MARERGNETLLPSVPRYIVLAKDERRGFRGNSKYKVCIVNKKW